MTTTIRETTASDLEAILDVEQRAFGEEGAEIKELVSNLLNDPSARPVLSLMAFDEDIPVGHILFTRAYLDHLTDGTSTANMAILAPLAVIPEKQKSGVGGSLIREGLQRLKESGVSLVFVLGHIDYYPRHGFEPAIPHGFEPAYPIAPENADAWMVQELADGGIAAYSGRVSCADSMMREEYWAE